MAFWNRFYLWVVGLNRHPFQGVDQRQGRRVFSRMGVRFVGQTPDRKCWIWISSQYPLVNFTQYPIATIGAVPLPRRDDPRLGAMPGGKFLNGDQIALQVATRDAEPGRKVG